MQSLAAYKRFISPPLAFSFSKKNIIENANNINCRKTAAIKKHLFNSPQHPRTIIYAQNKYCFIVQ